MGIKSITFDGEAAKKLTINGGVYWEKPVPYEFIEKVFFGGTGMFELPFNMTGSDTIRAKFQMTSTSGNLFGYFNDSSADDNFCLYGSSSSYIRYDGGLYRNWDLRSATGTHDIVFSPTDLTDGSTSIATWTRKSFTGGHPAVGGLPNSTTAKAKWFCYGWSVDGKCNLLPAIRKADNKAGLYDTLNDVFYSGSFISVPSTVAYD